MSRTCYLTAPGHALCGDPGDHLSQLTDAVTCPDCRDRLRERGRVGGAPARVRSRAFKRGGGARR